MLLENSKKRSYSCLMLDCKDLGKDIKAIQSEIDKEDLYDEDGSGLEKEFHITILYGIHEQNPDAVKEEIEFEPMEYELTGLSLFETDDYDVLKCTVKSKDLRKWNKECTQTLDFTNNYPEYKPHLTVAYLNPGTGKKYIKHKSKIFNKAKTSNTIIFSNADSKKTKYSV